MVNHNRNTTLDSGILQSLSSEVVECILRLVTKMEKLPKGLSQFAEGTSKILPGKETFQQRLEAGTTIVLGSLKGCLTE